ncbi:putative gamma-tubulin complex component gcp5 [Diplodia seriata]|uniref:Spindle pole body component n=1 Tax=Diplodia seriata TaxID=420778 RepID=A0A0G2HI98_9PEZI|nr:putative gamma-tubulin complex component gcp5 [Diplodia seriata]
MAHSASLNSAATELIYKVVGPTASDNPRKFRRTRDAVLRGLRSQQWARVNQFDVQSSYEGLMEKFIVLDREDLAETLEDRLRELLQLQTKWTPDILALFLSLSDRPVENSRLEDLERIKPAEHAPELTWADIIADDPLDEEGIWDDIDYAAESSEDEPAPRQRKRAPTKDTTPASSVVDEDEFTAAAEACIVSPDPSVLQGIEEAQFWRQAHKRDSMLPKPETHITELQALQDCCLGSSPRLFSGYGLWESLDALDFIYLSKDGSLMQAFADTVFEKLDRGRRGWNDRYVMSEIARSIYGTVPSVLADKLAIRTAPIKEKSRTSPRSVKALGAIAVDYFLPWHIVNVVQRNSTATYQRVFVLLLQVYRARYVLRASSLWRSTAALHRTTASSSAAASSSSRTRHLQYHLRHRLLWLADTFHSYLAETAIASAAADLRHRLAAAADIDEMAAVHADHVARLEARCLLAKQLAPIHGAFVELLDLCVAFADLTSEEEGKERGVA